MTRRSFLLIAHFLTVAGCTVGPNYRRPKIDVQPKWAATDAGMAGQPTSRPSVVQLGGDLPERWWTSLGDSTLNTLVEKAARSNLDLRSATARVREARARRVEAEAGLFPTAHTASGYDYYHNDGPLFPVKTDDYNFLVAGFDAAWEVDVFGGTRRAIEEAGDNLQAQAEARRDVLVSLLAEVCRDYLQLRTAQRRIEIANDNLRIERQSLALAQRLRAAGVAGDLDVTRAQAEVTTTAATLPTLDIEAKQSIHALGVLLGESPDALVTELSPTGPLPQPPARVPVGLPSDLLRRRPDVRRVERQLAAATASIGVAEANLYPQFSLTGEFGVGATDAAQLFKWSSRYAGVGPSVRWLLFDAGRILADVDARRAVSEQLLADYQQTILLAVREVEDALVAFEREQDRRDLLRQTVEFNTESVHIAHDQYATGLTGFLTVLDAERSLLASQDALTISDGAISLDLVALYKGLGGGWQAMEPDTQKAPPTTAAVVKR